MTHEHSTLIIGGGFAGIACAQTLARNAYPGKIILVSDKSHFEYKSALYRVVTGRSPLEVCLPLSEIFAHTDVELLEDSITDIDLKKNIAHGTSGAHYRFDALVLALGSQPAFFAIPGLRERSFGFMSMREALRLKRHLHEIFTAAAKATPAEKIPAMHFIVVGAGASGVEAAGELALYCQALAHKHGIAPSLLTFDLIEAQGRVLPALTPAISTRAEKRLQELRVNLLLNRTVVKNEIEGLLLKDMKMKTKTVIWTAGVTPNSLYREISGLQCDAKGRVEVDAFMRAQGWKNVYIIGDGANTKWGGMAQTAVAHGKVCAGNIIATTARKKMQRFTPREPVYAIPVGHGWAAVQIGRRILGGRLGWIVRRLADLRYFLSILPGGKALTAWREGGVLSEQCGICTKDEGAVQK